MAMIFSTAGLADTFAAEVEAAEPLLRSFGGAASFRGSIVTLDVFEDSGLLYEAVQQPGRGKVLVVDGGGSLQRSLVQGDLAQLACDNGWQGIVVYGCVREALRLAQIPIGILALAPAPIAAWRRGRGSSKKPVHFSGVTFREGQFIYADADGVLVAARDLLVQPE